MLACDRAGGGGGAAGGGGGGGGGILPLSQDSVEEKRIMYNYTSTVACEDVPKGSIC